MRARAAAPALWEYDPAKGEIVGHGVPSANATTAQAVAATDTTVFFGAGSILHGGGGKSKAALYAYDRSSREFTHVTPSELQRDASIRELAVVDDKLIVGTAGHAALAQLAVMDLSDLTAYRVAESDTEGGGSLWTYDPRTERFRCYVDPIDEGQCVRGVATKDGVAYLGSDNNTGAGPKATAVAFDPVAGKELWRVDPQQSAGVAALAIRGRHVYGVSRKGGLFVVDIPRRKLLHRADISAVSNGYAAMVTDRGVVYGVSDTTVFRFHPRTFAVSTVVADINGGWYSGSRLTNDESGRLYTMRGRNLVQITDRPEF
ncbi:hypothetical protein AB0B50_29455 [Streptomyces sp. NPDC041068]|uniref:hypothetical protein n=1 Tax=Streptomyces sp. NPDC041068 TaxID=3155130 RepID=UPI0033EB9138